MYVGSWVLGEDDFFHMPGLGGVGSLCRASVGRAYPLVVSVVQPNIAIEGWAPSPTCPKCRLESLKLRYPGEPSASGTG